MQPISANDYYTQFQTALFIAVEELGLKQAYLAELCAISPGYLSKLRGWNCDSATKALRPRPHMTQTNFKAYAVPLLEELQRHPRGIRFEDGYFISGNEQEANKWGELLLDATDPINFPATRRRAFPDLLPELDDIEFPAEGELTIEWNFDFHRDPQAQAKAAALLNKLAERANGQVRIQVKMNVPPKPRFKSGISDKDIHHRQVMLRGEPEPESYLPASVPNTPFFHFDVDPNGSPFESFEHITVKDNRNDRLIEQFCDPSHWNLLQGGKSFFFNPDERSFKGQGIHNYLFSRYEYGRQPFIVHAELEFHGYTTENPEDPYGLPNAGFILGFNKADHARPEYYHLLLTGECMLLERVGARTGDPVDDFEHVDAGVPFLIKDGIGYNFLLRVEGDALFVSVNHELLYHVQLPEKITGYVGLRPWRAQVICRYFEIRER